MLDLGTQSGDGRDVAEHLDTLEVAAVEPTEVGFAGLGGLPVDEFDHGSDPLRIAETIQSSLICRVYFWAAIVALEGVAFGADAVGDGSEFATDLASDGGDAPGVAGHFAGVGESADDFPGLGARESDELGEESRGLGGLFGPNVL